VGSTMTSDSTTSNAVVTANGANHEGSPCMAAVRCAQRGEDIRVSLTDRICRSLHHTWLEKAERCLALPRNIYYSRLLHAEDIWIGSGNTIKGITGLQIGRSFRALDQLWLAAIDCDRAGRRYTPSLIIGNNVTFGYGVHVAATNVVRIGNDVLVGSRVIVTDHNHGIYQGGVQTSPLEGPADRPLTRDTEVVIEDNVWIGDGVAILPGSRIGQGSIIGANSVVRSTIPKFCVAAGNPARAIKVYDSASQAWIPADSNRCSACGG
jgi:lipopolysaccharide O-acetyltransferase